MYNPNHFDWLLFLLNLNVINTIRKQFSSLVFVVFIRWLRLALSFTKELSAEITLICWICWWLDSPWFPSGYSTYTSPRTHTHTHTLLDYFILYSWSQSLCCVRQILGDFSGEDLKDPACASTSESHQQSQRTQSQALLSLFDTSVMWSSADMKDCEDLGKGATVLVICRCREVTKVAAM